MKVQLYQRDLKLYLGDRQRLMFGLRKDVTEIVVHQVRYSDSGMAMNRSTETCNVC